MEKAHEFKLEIQDPAREEMKEKEASAESALESIRSAINNAEDVSELENIIFESDNTALISLYSKMRFNFLKDNNTFMDGDEEKLFDLELESYSGVDDNGNLLDMGGNPTGRSIDTVERKAKDSEFLTSSRKQELLLAV